MGCGSSGEKAPAAQPQPQPAPAPAQPQAQQQQPARKEPVGHFQIELQGQWKDYEDEEDRILKRGFMSGFPNAKFHLRGQNYEYNFKSMKQINTGTGKERKIRPPMRMKPPAKPLVPEGPTMVIKVRNGQAGKKIQVPHPKDKSINITVVVPPNAKVGQELLIPIPPLPGAGGVAPPSGDKGGKGGAGWSTGAKTAAGATAVGAAALVVGGAILYVDEGSREAALGAAGAVGDAAAPHVAAVGEAVAPHAEAVADWAAPAAADAGEWAAGAAGDIGSWTGAAAEDIAEWAPDAAEDAGEWIVEAGDTAGAFIMDLF